jgi:soluble lytic murein transglycosylase-like protein
MVSVLALALGGCASALPPSLQSVALRQDNAELAAARPAPASPRAMDGLIAKYAAEYDVPESLIRRVIVRESGYNPRARNGPYYGLMQIRYDTAQTMGYRGPASGLLDADTNLRYGVKYLSGAYMVGGGNSDQAVRNYARGYYYEAKARGLLEEVGLR